VSLYKKLKWKKAVNEFKFVTEELKLIRSISRSASSEFQEYYEKYLLSKGFELHQLNKENKKRINAQERSDKPEGAPVTPRQLSSCTDLVLYKQIYTEEELEQTEAEYTVTQDDVELHEAFAKLFKNIAIQTHPDKLNVYDYDFLERQARTRDFNDANEALTEKQYFTLIEIAQKYEISLPRNYNQQSRWMKREIKKIKHQIGQEKQTYNYAFSEAETDEERTHVIQNFTEQMFGRRL
tara:strand:- start:186 stop:899 length:714 start_codon:yes stop_codon:yes gene_type:complete